MSEIFEIHNLNFLFGRTLVLAIGNIAAWIRILYFSFDIMFTIAAVAAGGEMIWTLPQVEMVVMTKA